MSLYLAVLFPKTQGTRVTVFSRGVYTVNQVNLNEEYHHTVTKTINTHLLYLMTIDILYLLLCQ